MDKMSQEDLTHFGLTQNFPFFQIFQLDLMERWRLVCTFWTKLTRPIMEYGGSYELQLKNILRNFKDYSNNLLKLYISSNSLNLYLSLLFKPDQVNLNSYRSQSFHLHCKSIDWFLYKCTIYAFLETILEVVKMSGLANLKTKQSLYVNVSM